MKSKVIWYIDVKSEGKDWVNLAKIKKFRYHEIEGKNILKFKLIIFILYKKGKTISQKSFWTTSVSSKDKPFMTFFETKEKAEKALIKGIEQRRLYLLKELQKISKKKQKYE